MKITLNTKLYPLEAVYGAAYIFIDRAYIFLDYNEKGLLEVSLKMKDDAKDMNEKELEGEFMNELLNYICRIKITKRNKKIREYIIERALYSSIEQGDVLNTGDDFDDPLGIAVPWEEKYG